MAQKKSNSKIEIEGKSKTTLVRNQNMDLFDIAPVSYFIFDKYGLILNANQKACQMLKMERAALIGKQFSRFLSDSDKDNFYLHLQKVLESANTQSTELTFITEMGSSREGKLESILVREPEEKIFQIWSALIDVTDIKRNRTLKKDNPSIRGFEGAAAQRAKENYRLLFEQSPVSIWEEDFSEIKRMFDQLQSAGITDFQNYFTKHPQKVKEMASMVRLTDVNQATLKLFGLNSKEEILHKGFVDWFDQNSWPIFQKELVSLAEGKTEFNAEIQVSLRNESVTNLMMNLLVSSQHSNTLEKVFVTFIDITSLKIAEHDLLKQKQVTDKYLQVANSMILVLDQDGKICLINEKGLEILGHSRQQVVGKNWFDHFIPEEKRSEMRDVHQRVISGLMEQVEYYENDILVKGDELRTIEWHNSLVEGENGKLVSVISSGIDVTDRKKAERAAIASIYEGQEQERKRIAQELHDSLSQQLAATRMLLSSAAPDLKNINPDSYQLYQNAVNILEGSIRDVRNISRNLTPIMLQGSGLFTAVEKLYRQYEVASTLNFNFDKSGDDQKIDQIKAVSLYRILQELINNVIKHAAATKVNILISQEKDNVTLVVEDNGIGFENGAKEQSSNGMGLKNIVSRVQGMEGDMTIDTSPKTGTMVKIIVPLT
jgi:PAS domain S-box-containing protein